LLKLSLLTRLPVLVQDPIDVKRLLQYNVFHDLIGLVLRCWGMLPQTKLLLFISISEYRYKAIGELMNLVSREQNEETGKHLTLLLFSMLLLGLCEGLLETIIV